MADYFVVLLGVYLLAAVVIFVVLRDKQFAWVGWLCFLLGTPVLGFIVGLCLPRVKSARDGSVRGGDVGVRGEDPMARWEREQRSLEVIRKPRNPENNEVD